MWRKEDPHMFRRLTSVAAFALVSTVGFAADLPLPDEPIPAAAPLAATYNWTGFYIGAMGGFAFDGESDWDFNAFGTSSTTDLDGWFAGGTVGAQWQMNWLVLGVEGDASWADISGADPCPNAAFSCEVDIDWLASARGRVGVAWDRFLIFGTGGAAFAGVEADSPPFTPGVTFDETYFGWTAGGGVEIGIWQNLSVKGEYAFYDLGDETAPAGVLDVGTVDVDNQFHAAKFGLNWRF
jgi:outer membrane immunogenic protein